MKKIRVAALGGGMGTLSALFDLTHPKNPARDRYDITLYQVGWMLGGKGASGRNLDPQGFGRIEEHGLHNLFGFYDNMFRLLRDCYAELDRPEGHPLRSWRDGVSAESTAVFVERVGDRFVPWQLFNPTNALDPGEGDAWLPLWDALHLALGFLDLNLWHVPDAPPTPEQPTKLHPLLEPVRAALYVALRALDALRGSTLLFPKGSRRRAFARKSAERTAASAIRAAQHLAWKIAEPRVDASDEARRGWALFHFASAVAIGLLEEGVLGKSLDPLDEYDFREWLLPRLIDDGGRTANGAMMKVMYESSFAYRDGDTSIPAGETFPPKADYGAGSLLRGVIRSSLTYKGAFGWKFTSGTGDVLFAPIYEVLKRRGVKVEFFHRVDRVEADARGTRIEKLVLARQVRLKDPTKEYQPLIELGGVPCWPSVPLYDQLVEGEALREKQIDLERHLSGFPDAEQRELHVGRDFDAVILGISVGAFPWICRDLIDKNHRFREMVQHLRTTRTEALQIWLDLPTPACGWKPKGRPITGFWYDEKSPLNVWADLTHLIAAESWGEHAPRHLSWFVSPMADEVPLALTEHGPLDTEAGVDPVRAHQIAREHADVLLRDHVPRVLMPNIGRARRTAEYVRANVAPSDRYVLTVKGSTKYRLPANDPDGFANLYLAGDWTKNGLDNGAMESACLSGRLASSALSGWPGRENKTRAELI